MAIIKKDFPTLNADIVTRLAGLGYTDANYQGTPIRNMVESVDLHLANLYSDMASNMSDAYLSTASDGATDALGLLVGLKRYSGEQTINFKARISQAIQTGQGTNLITLTSNLLNLSNIRNVIVRPFTQGLGSLTFYLIGTSGIADSTTVNLATSTISSLTAAGTYSVCTTPDPLTINIQASITTNTTDSTLTTKAIAAVNAYLNTLSMGDTFVVSELEASILNSSSSIIDVSIQTISVVDSLGNITQQLIRNFTPDYDQQIIPGSVIIN